jgi:hypothetical protein
VWSKYSNLLKPRVMALSASERPLEDVTSQF